MATRTATATQNTPVVTAVRWTGLLVGDDGSWFMPSEHPDRTVQVSGTFGGAVVNFEGSNDPGASPASGALLSNQAGVPLAFSAAGARLVAEATRWVRPVLVGGDGTTSLTVDLIARR